MRNAEGYPDPTVGTALANIAREEREKVRDLISILKKVAELAGFEVIGRIALRDIRTGKKFK